MADAEKMTITIKDVGKKVWQKPGSEQLWYTVVSEENPSEPLRFIQNKDKGAPEPKVGEKFTGNMYDNEKFYVFADKETKPSAFAAGGGYSRDDAAIKAQFAIKAAIAFTAGNEATTLDVVEDYAKDLFHMVDRVKNAPDSPKTSLRDAWDKRVTDPGPGDNDMPSDFLE